MFRLKPYHEVLCYPTCQKKNMFTLLLQLYTPKKEETLQKGEAQLCGNYQSNKDKFFLKIDLPMKIARNVTKKWGRQDNIFFTKLV